MFIKSLFIIFATLSIINCAHTSGRTDDLRAIANTKPEPKVCKILNAKGEVVKVLQYDESVILYKSAEVPQGSMCIPKKRTCGRDIGAFLEPNGSHVHLTCKVVQDSEADPAVSP